MLYIGCILSLIIPLRPTVSQSEKRKLTTFPAFSFSSLISGSYFSGISTWFSDTFPFREQMITLNGYFDEWQGIQTEKVHGQVEDGEDIPDKPMEESIVVSTTQMTANSTTAASTSAGTNATATTATATTSHTTTTAKTQTAKTKAANLNETQSFSAVLLVGNQAFEYYNFNQSVTNRYISLINRASAALKGTANVYDMVVPNSMGIQLPDNLRSSIHTSDQKKAIAYMYGSMKDVKTVNIYDTLTTHRQEYIYFRTDHHWTALGAYYGYEQLMQTMGLTPVPLTSYQKADYGQFLGSFYSSTEKAPALGNTPDELIAYKLFSNAKLMYTNTNGTQRTWPIVNDVSKYGKSMKYSAFIAGDNPYTIITNSDLKDGSSCVVIKESYGNALVPFLVAHYQTVHVIDYRYWKGNLATFVKGKGIKSVIFINNISATRSDSLVGCMEKLF